MIIVKSDLLIYTFQTYSLKKYDAYRKSRHRIGEFELRMINIHWFKNTIKV